MSTTAKAFRDCLVLIRFFAKHGSFAKKTAIDINNLFLYNKTKYPKG